MSTRYADGAIAVKSEAAAERVFNEIFIPQYIESIQRKANEKARDEMNMKRPSQKDKEVINIMNDFEGYIEGR